MINTNAKLDLGQVMRDTGSVMYPQTRERNVWSRFELHRNETTVEEVVVDERCHMSSAEVIESRLIERLGNSSLPMSHLRIGSICNRGRASE